jgi:DNA-binding NtrC family response regulator
MESPFAVLFADDSSSAEPARRALGQDGIESVVARTPQEAHAALRAHPRGIVIALATGLPPPQLLERIAALARLRAGEGAGEGNAHILGKSPSSEALRRRIRELATSPHAVLFVGEEGSGRAHAALSLHHLSAAPGRFRIVRPDEPAAVEAAVREGLGTLYFPSIDHLPWPVQDAVAAAIGAGAAAPRVMASTTVDPAAAADDGRLSPALVAGFRHGLAAIAPLRERASDVEILARAFIDDVQRLNGLPPVVVAGDALVALTRYGWPGNVAQLRAVIETSVILARDGTVRLEHLPDEVRGASAGAGGRDGAARRFREAKRSVVHAFERSYLEDLLQRHHGNVTGAAEQSGMLRSALQRLLRKHDLHSADFRQREGPGRFAS